MVNPEKYTQLISKYSPYLINSPLLDLDVDAITGNTKVSITFEFIPHPDYGNTKLRVREWYDSTGELLKYRYCWEVNRRPTGNISAWENEHGHGVSTDPHHNHHVPFDRKPVRENPDVRCLEDAFNAIMQYIIESKPYVP